MKSICISQMIRKSRILILLIVPRNIPCLAHDEDLNAQAIRCFLLKENRILFEAHCGVAKAVVL